MTLLSQAGWPACMTGPLVWNSKDFEGSSTPFTEFFTDEDVVNIEAATSYFLGRFGSTCDTGMHL